MEAFDLKPGHGILDGRAIVVKATYSDPCCNSVGVMTLVLYRRGRLHHNGENVTVTIPADKQV